MANDKKYRKGVAKIKKKLLTIIIAIVIILLGSFFVSEEEVTMPDEVVTTLEQVVTQAEEVLTTPEQAVTQTQEVVEQPEGAMTLHMIECGQADSFLLVQNDTTALIDCGETDTADDVVAYLNSIGITKLDYVVGTHPHDDHMGGMEEVITSFEVGTIIIPEMEADVSTANWFTSLMEELSTGKYEVEQSTLGTVYELGEATMKVIGPIEVPTSNTNNYSIVMKVTYGEIDIIMTGDAETAVENDILETGEDLSAEILKVGHHGSDTSSSDKWLDAIDPDYALISCKVGNSHGHPIKSVMDKLEERGIEVYRTDECGTVVATITADSVTFNAEPGDYLSGEELEEKEGE